MWSKTLFLAIVLTLTVLPVTSLMAQEVEEKVKAETDGATATPDDQEEPAAEDKKKPEKPAVKLRLAEIAVTGELVERPLSETTTSVKVLTEENLQRNDAYRIYDTVRHIPNVTPAPPDFMPAIRGLQGGGPLGLGGGLLAASQPRAKLIVGGVERLANYANNVYQSMFDVEQVEVLRGPQATTRGPNAIAGVFNVNTKDPVFFSERAVQTRFDWNEVSGFGKRVNYMHNVPVGKELAMRFVLQYEEDRNPVQVYDDGTPDIPPGTDFDALSEYNTLTLRNKFLWVPQELPDFSGLFTLEYQNGRDSAFDSWIWGTDSEMWAPDGISRDPEDRMYGWSGGQRIFDTEDYGFTSDLRYNVGDTGELRSITAYMKIPSKTRRTPTQVRRESRSIA